jgi:hypothetical protein
LITGGFAGGSLLAGLAIAQPALHYNVTDLGALPNVGFSQANVVSQEGFVVGASASGPSPARPQHAVVWYNRSPQEIMAGTIPASPVCPSSGRTA